MKKILIALALLTSQSVLSKEACYQVTEAHYSESEIQILDVHEVILTNASGEDYAIEDRKIVKEILAKNAGIESIESGYEYSSVDNDLAEISVCLNLDKSREVSSDGDDLLSEYQTTKIKNAKVTSIKVYKGKKYEKKHLPLADTLNNLNKLL